MGKRGGITPQKAPSAQLLREETLPSPSSGLLETEAGYGLMKTPESFQRGNQGETNLTGTEFTRIKDTQFEGTPNIDQNKVKEYQTQLENDPYKDILPAPTGYRDMANPGGPVTITSGHEIIIAAHNAEVNNVVVKVTKLYNGKPVTHRQIVETGIREGKFIEDEAINAYPDLKARYETMLKNMPAKQYVQQMIDKGDGDITQGNLEKYGRFDNAFMKELGNRLYDNIKRDSYGTYFDDNLIPKEKQGQYESLFPKSPSAFRENLNMNLQQAKYSFKTKKGMDLMNALVAKWGETQMPITLTKAEHGILDAYKSSYYEAMRWVQGHDNPGSVNNWSGWDKYKYRDGKSMTPDQFYKKVHAEIKLVDKVMARSKTPEPLVVYRGIARGNPNYSEFAKANVGDIVQSKYYLSTSFMEGLSRRFISENSPTNDGILFKIYAPKGTSAVQLESALRYNSKDFMNDAGWTKEGELLLNKKMRLRVIGKNLVSDPATNGQITTLEMEVMK